MVQATPTLLDRIGRLERQHRRTRQLAIVMALLAASSFWLGAALPPAPVEGASFVLKDAGKMRAGLAPAADGAALTFYDAQGRPRIRLSLQGDRASLAVVGEDGRTREFLSPKGGIFPLREPSN